MFRHLRAALELVNKRLEVEEGKVELTVMVLVTLIEKEKQLIIHGLANLCVCQIVMPKKYQHQRKDKCYRRQVWGLKNKI